MTIRRPVLKETLMFYDPLSGYANESSWEAETETKNRPKMLKQNIIYILFFFNVSRCIRLGNRTTTHHNWFIAFVVICLFFDPVSHRCGKMSLLCMKIRNFLWKHFETFCAKFYDLKPFKEQFQCHISHFNGQGQSAVIITSNHS